MTALPPDTAAEVLAHASTELPAPEPPLLCPLCGEAITPEGLALLLELEPSRMGPLKYGVPKSQWDEMAKHNDYDQLKLWGTTRAILMEFELTGRKPQNENDTIRLAEYWTQGRLL